MATFFEKLTGAKTATTPSSPAYIEPAVVKTPLKAPPRRIVSEETEEEEQKPKTTHLKVETDGPIVTAREEIAEEEMEEGELTVDIYDRGDSIVVQSTVAGVKPEDLDVSITNDTVTIRGKRERAEEIKEKDYYYKELFWGTFSRSIILPEEVEGDLAEAVLKNGLLSLRLPKKRRGVVQKVKVKVT